MGAIIGYWRCGVDESVISAIMSIPLYLTTDTINLYITPEKEYYEIIQMSHENKNGIQKKLF